jgi:Tol biopolymer transport system component
MRRLSRLLPCSLAVLAWAGCSEGPSGPTPPANESLPPVILSDPVGSGTAPAIVGAGGGIIATATFVSLPPGSLPGAASVAITNVTAGGDPVTVAVVDGGFDPVAVPGAEGDELLLEFRGPAGTILARKAGAVPGSRPPAIVRVSPPKGRTDVALGVRPTVVFSEPVDPATLGARVRLLQAGGEVAGTVAALPAAPWVVEFIPAAALAPATEYHLEIDAGVLDVEGDALADALTVEFLTTTAPEPPGPLPTGTERIAFVSTRSGGPRIYLANTDGSGVVELTAGESPAWSPEGQRIAFSVGSNLYLINANGSGLHLVASGAWHPSWSPDGAMLAYVEDATGTGTGGSNISVMNADGSERRVVVRSDFRGSPEWLSHPDWSPDGQHLAFVAPTDWYAMPNRTYLVSLDGGSDPSPLLDVGDAESIWMREDPAWSPDGMRVAFGTVQHTPGDELNPPLPYFAVASLPDGEPGSIAVHFHGPTERVWNGTLLPWAGDPDWSPDGRFLAFTLVQDGPVSSAGSPTRIHVVDLLTGESRQLIPDAPATDQGYQDSQMAWSPASP